jgi:hypothetical protein
MVHALGAAFGENAGRAKGEQTCKDCCGGFHGASY